MSQIDIGYRNSRNQVRPFSSSPQNALVKIPWGPPVSFDYEVRREGTSLIQVNLYLLSPVFVCVIVIDLTIYLNFLV